MILNVLLTRQEETHLNCSCVQLHLTSASYRSLSTKNTYNTANKRKIDYSYNYKETSWQKSQFSFYKKEKRKKEISVPREIREMRTSSYIYKYMHVFKHYKFITETARYACKKTASIITSLLSLTRKCNNESYSRTLI